MRRVLVARLDNAGDVILAGPAVRAVTADAEVTFLCSPIGEPAARLLPGVSEVLVYDPPWAGAEPPSLDTDAAVGLVEAIGQRGFSAAAILTSFHQSPLPLALLLRIARVPEIAAVSVDYPGSLLDHRLPYLPQLHEVQRGLQVVGALGFPPPPDDQLSLVRSGRSPGLVLEDDPHVVVHPGASVPARALPRRLTHEVLTRLVDLDVPTVLTGSAAEQRSLPAPPGVLDLRGRTTFAALVEVIGGAAGLVAGNTGPVHVAAATGTPVVEVFAPVVSAVNWKPWKVPAVILGDPHVACAGCRARTCPLEIQACVDRIDGNAVLAALESLGAVRKAVGNTK